MSTTKHKTLANGFRAVRELMGMPQTSYARLFDAERAFVQELEEGRLPAILDQRLLKFMLLSFTLNREPKFISDLLQQINNFYGLDHVFNQEFPLLALYEQTLGKEMAKWPWIIDSARFRCKAIEKKRLGSFLMLWGQKGEIHNSLILNFPQQAQAFISFVDGRTIIVIPSIYLFLDLNTTSSSNPIVKDLELKLEKRETIGLAIPKETPDLQNLDTIIWEKLRLFSYSQDNNMLREAAFR
ncbi:MAG: hypothetical protein HY819_10300 [Acidobacteria bacterium]|nr:hypothetical protein [Acidobacteriota bacterium]